MRAILFFISMIIFITGCSFRSGPKNGKEIEITNDQRIYTQSGSLSATAPNNFNKVPFKGYTRFDHDLINFDRHLPNMMSEDVRMTVSIIPQDKMSKYNYRLINRKESDLLEKTLQTQPLTEFEKKRYAQKGVNYSVGYIDYIGGLRCQTTVESSNIALGIGTKSYQTFCNYHDVHKQLKELWIMYSYTYTHNGTKYVSDTKSSSITPEAMQTQFKQDMKAIFDSLVIHDMDREKMSKEVLLHDKKYEISKW